MDVEIDVIGVIAHTHRQGQHWIESDIIESGGWVRFGSQVFSLNCPCIIDASGLSDTIDPLVGEAGSHTGTSCRAGVKKGATEEDRKIADTGEVVLLPLSFNFGRFIQERPHGPHDGSQRASVSYFGTICFSRSIRTWCAWPRQQHISVENNSRSSLSRVAIITQKDLL